MKKLYILLLVFNCVIIFSQENEVIKTQKSKKGIEKYYFNNDSSISIKIYNKQGLLKEIRNYSDDSQTVEHGEWIEYHSNSTIKYVRYFKNGIPTSIWSSYDKTGNLEKSIDYDFSIKYAIIDISSDKLELKNIQDSNSVFLPEKLPLFNGGDINSFRSYIQKNLTLDYYFVEKYHKTGYHKIFVQFAIDQDGILVDLLINDQGEKCLEKEAARVIRQSPKWTSAYRQNKPVKVRFTFPVMFVFP